MSDLQTRTVGEPPGVPPGLVGTDDQPPERPGPRRWPVLLLVVLLVAGVATYAAIRFFAGADDRAIDVVPPRSMAYVNLFLEPSTSQRRAIRDLLERFPVKTPDRAQNLLANLLDEPLAEIGLEFQRDVEPWLGDQIAGFVLPPASLEGDFHGGVLLATEDESATREAVEKYRKKARIEVRVESFKEHDYEVLEDPAEGGPSVVTGFVEAFFYVGTEPGFKAAVDAADSGRSLADNERYAAAVRGLRSDRLAVAYVDTKDVMSMLVETGGREMQSLRSLGLAEGQTQAAALYATSESIVLDQVSEIPDRGLTARLADAFDEPGVIERLPESTWLALSIPDLGTIAKSLFAEVSNVLPGGLGPAAVNEQIRADTGVDLSRDVFSWLGDGGFFVSGANRVDIGGGAVLTSKDPRASRRAVHRIAGLLLANDIPAQQQEWTWQGNVEDETPDEPTKGYAVGIGAEEPVHLIAGSDRVVVAYGDDAAGNALEASSYLGEELSWTESIESLEPDHVPFFFMHLPTARLALESFGADQDPMYVEDVKSWLDPLSHVISGVRREGDRLWVRTVIGVL